MEDAPGVTVIWKKMCQMVAVEAGLEAGLEAGPVADLEADSGSS